MSCKKLPASLRGLAELHSYKSKKVSICICTWMRSGYVKKKVKARGRFCTRSEGNCPGRLRRPGRAAMIPELMVTIKNKCYFSEMSGCSVLQKTR
jgi:hypothetical protein